ncbi:MAG: hypothetical protein Q9160_007590 [Pyrenula sp. 1 TL-2023]
MGDHKLRNLSSFPEIDSTNAQIRLLALAPGDADAPIRCKYHVTGLNGAVPSYEPLSYAWHDISSTEHLAYAIFIDSEEVVVSETLFHAIKRLRLSQDIRYVWIDAICINQADDCEKTEQVNMMRRIYSQCEQCAIWLGSLGDITPEDAQAALDTVAWIAGDQPPFWFRDSSRRIRVAHALRTLITSSWWGRIWTVQEAILPPNATLYWGPCQLSWTLMHRAAQAIVEGTAPGIPPEFDEALGHICSAMNGLRYSPHEQLLDLLWRWRFRRSTDPRDKVYTLMGIQNNLIQPDYTIDVVTLFTRVTANFIGLSGDLEPLIGQRGETSVFKELPTWAIDWVGHLDGTGVSEFWLHDQRYHQREYAADRGLYGVGDGLRMATDRTLILSGVYVDKVAIVERADHPIGNDATQLAANGERWGELITNYHIWLATHKAESQPNSNWMQAFLGLITGKLIPDDPNNCDSLEDWLGEILLPQKVFVTDQGRVGVGPLSLKPGQQLWVVGGCRFPVILQSLSNHGTRNLAEDLKSPDLTFVGDCFVHGIMRGEAGEAGTPVDIRLH